MNWKPTTAALGALSLALTACGGSDGGNEATTAQPGEAAEAAGDQTIAAGLDQNGRFVQALKATGLDATLAGPGPYTVLVPADEAFNKLPAGTVDGLMEPAQRAQLTEILTFHILPGTVLVEDIGRAIDNAEGPAVLATMGGETLNAAREDGKVVLTDGAGNRATISEGDQRRTNGVVHIIDGVLMPGEPAAAEDEGEAAPQQ